MERYWQMCSMSTVCVLCTGKYTPSLSVRLTSFPYRFDWIHFLFSLLLSRSLLVLRPSDFMRSVSIKRRNILRPINLHRFESRPTQTEAMKTMITNPIAVSGEPIKMVTSVISATDAAAATEHTLLHRLSKKKELQCFFIRRTFYRTTFVYS